MSGLSEGDEVYVDETSVDSSSFGMGMPMGDMSGGMGGAPGGMGGAPSGMGGSPGGGMGPR